MTISFEFDRQEHAVVVFRKEPDGTRKPIAYLYSMLQVDAYALKLEADEDLATFVPALRLAATGILPETLRVKLGGIWREF